jgi:hypothetical protein
MGATPGSGFLGVEYDPFFVLDPNRPPNNTTLSPGVTDKRYTRRLGLAKKLEQDFAKSGGEVAVQDHQVLYDKAAKMVLSPNIKAFDLSHEPDSLREQYGKSAFGQGCLLARRLVETGVTFVEVRSNGWDTHQQNFTRVPALAKQVDPAFATLLADLKQRGLLDRTLVVWMGEFGRTPRINGNGGRDHWPRSFNAALAGAGIKGGQVIGSTNGDGTEVKDQPVGVTDLLSSFCHALRIDPRKENMSPLGRPLKIVDGGTALPQLFS